ncbi:hypothetical protein AAFF_G00336360 [Aldrovandia affinis]|uniref:TERF1-interacting nuclear factor 2 N-terminal domain-containing protein n=1 Tax=Aldrovandia affinis TaxID=143900 RepID=A0AAD7W005_9TELE|nr:hypothetical protein AAFF_G00336360 [Aldrovandia affinis]
MDAEVTSDHSLLHASLRTLAPPMQLVMAAMWRVMQLKEVLHYGKLEEFVSSVSETTPGLLSYRHRAKLTLGLRARMILELCRSQEPPNPITILPHLDRIRPPLCKGKKDMKVETSARSFQLLVTTLLKSRAEREHFFQEVFVVEYGPQFDAALQKLFWEFLSRLDQLLPLPDLAQTVSWLNTAPSVLEECAPANATQLLNTLLQHHKHLGHLDTVALPSSTGDSILSSLSLPPSGLVPTANQVTTDTLGQLGGEPTSLTHPANHRRGWSCPITPVIGLISNQDLPFTNSPGRGASRARAMANHREEAGPGGGGGVCEEQDGRSKRRKPEQEEDENSDGRRGEKRERRRASERLRRREGVREERPGSMRLVQQEGAGLSPITSCLQRQPRVVLDRLSLTDIARSLRKRSPAVTEGTRSPWRRGVGSVTRKRKFNDNVRTPQKQLSLSSEKENCADSSLTWNSSPVIPLRSQSQGDDDDIIIDSEDEEIRNIRGRLFIKQYYRTKHDTFVPTLKEFWRPCLA